LPNANTLAADLSKLDFDDRFVQYNAAVRRVGRAAAMLRKAAAAFTDPTLTHNVLMVGAARALGGDVDKALRFPSVLRKVAAAAERAITSSQRRDKHADRLRFIYGCVAKALERHTGKPASIRPDGPDARFVRAVIEHAGLPWKPSTWRRYGEEWAMVRDGAGLRPFFADHQTGWVYPAWLDPRTASVSNRRQKKRKMASARRD
jgi:hypothetical protein